MNESTTVMGDAGFLYIPGVNLKVPLYYKSKTKNSQAVVDEENSALYCQKYKGGHCDYIADHAGQGFDAIKRCTIGMLAFIVTPNSTTYYECVQITKGENRKSSLVTIGGQNVHKIKWANLCCYTCNDSEGKSITMVFFNGSYKVDKQLFK